MNAASWIILAVVVAIVALAIRVTFFKKKGGCGCHGGTEGSETAPRNHANTQAAQCASCQGCNAGCSSCPVASNVLQPTIKYLDETDGFHQVKR